MIKFTRQEYSNVLKNQGHKYYATAHEFIAPALENQAEQILHHAEKVIQQANNDIDIVCVYGGGSIMMREALESRLDAFCKRAMIKLLYVPEEFAVVIEAMGLEAFINSKIFESIKKNFLAKAKK